MASLSTYAANKQNDHLNGVAAYAMPAPYVALIRATAGQSPRSSAVMAGQTTIPATPNGHMYRCSATTGNTGSTEPSWPTAAGVTVTDGGVTWTEMTPDFLANNSNVTGNEANYTGYGRVALAGAMPASSAGSSTNTAALTFPACTAGTNPIGAVCTYDASAVGNLLRYATSSALLVITSAVSPISIPVGDFTTSQS